MARGPISTSQNFATGVGQSRPLGAPATADPHTADGSNMGWGVDGTGHRTSLAGAGAGAASITIAGGVVQIHDATSLNLMTTPIDNVKDPVSDHQVATKSYVDSKAGIKVLFQKVVHGDHSQKVFYNNTFNAPLNHLVVIQAAFAAVYDNESDVAWMRIDVDYAEKARGCLGARGGQYGDANTVSYVMVGDGKSHSVHSELAWYAGVQFKETSIVGYLIPFTPTP